MRDTLYADLNPRGQTDPGTPVLDYIKPTELVKTMIETGASKATLPIGHIIVRGMYGGALLAFATSISFYAAAQTGLPIVGAVFFPVGFMIITLLGVDLITGYFALVPLAFLHKRMSFAKVLSTFFWVIVGNVIGSVLYAVMCWIGFTMAGKLPDPSGLAAVTMKIGLAKTVHYEQFGAIGFFTCFVKAMLCNWMVTLGVVLPYASRSSWGKMIATYVPIFMFFAMGYEHMVVNMWIIPSAMLFGAPITMSDWWIGNELPAALGNFAGGFLFTGAALGWVYHTRRTIEEPMPPMPRPATV